MLGFSLLTLFCSVSNDPSPWDGITHLYVGSAPLSKVGRDNLSQIHLGDFKFHQADN